MTLVLEIGNGTKINEPSRAQLRDAIRDLKSIGEDESFLILSRGDQEYIQTAVSPAGWVVEFRDGGPDTHFQCTEPEIEENLVLQLMLDYHDGGPSFRSASWSPVSF